jgi:hypothetical protein
MSTSRQAIGGRNGYNGRYLYRSKRRGGKVFGPAAWGRFHGQGDTTGLPNDAAPIEIVDELFDETVLGDGRTATHFHTNDPRYWSWNGYTLWTVWDAGEMPVFTERVVELSKPNGNDIAGYGLVICQGNRTYLGKSYPTMLVVMINRDGEYTIGKAIGARYEVMTNWTLTPALQKNGTPNEVKVKYELDSVLGVNVFKLTINNSLVKTFQDTDEPKHTGGKNGYIVVISPWDTFPSKDVDVYFTEQR